MNNSNSPKDSSANKHFLNDQLWDNYDANKSIIDKKIPWVLKNIPDDVNSIIDVGCGNGIITNVLYKKYNISGVDMSQAALKHLNCPTIQCSSDNIPVKSSSFDMVFSSQLLEHLTDIQLTDTIKEFKRIAHKYILITVPNEEFLKFCEVQCPNCGNIFNTNGHMQSFTSKKIESIFAEDFNLIHHEVGGNLHRKYNPTLMNIRQRYGKRYFNPIKYTMCPKCDNDTFPYIHGNLISKACNGINRVISGKSPYWLLVLLKRNDV